MYSQNVSGPLSRMPAARKVRSGVERCAVGITTLPPLVPALRVAREHFDDVVMQAVVELLLEGPGELRVLDLARAHGVDVGMHGLRRGAEMDQHLDVLPRGPRLKSKQRMLVALQLGAHFFQAFAHSDSFRSRISFHTLSNSWSAGASNSTKYIVASEVSPCRCATASRSMISAHSRSGKPAIPVPTAGKAMVFSLFSRAILRE